MNKIIIVDDDKIVRDSLEFVLKGQNYDVVASGKNAAEAVSLYFKYKPDLMLMDIQMGESTGLEASKKILAKDSNAKILLLTTFHDKEYIDEAMRLGCKGYILKENIAGISSAIDSILNDRVVYDSNIIKSIMSNKEESTYSDITKNEKLSELSTRELEILSLVADGLNNKEIANELYLSEGTVRNYISNLLSKLELRDRTQLAIYYYKCK